MFASPAPYVPYLYILKHPRTKYTNWGTHGDLFNLAPHGGTDTSTGVVHPRFWMLLVNLLFVRGWAWAFSIVKTMCNVAVGQVVLSALHVADET